MDMKNPLKQNIIRALKAGVYGYIIKESFGNELVEAIRRANAGYRYLSRQITDVLIEDYLHLWQDLDKEVDPLDKLTSREREVLQLVVEGKSSSEISRKIDISTRTVETYRSKIMEKLNIDNIPGLVKFAIRNGLTKLNG